LRVRLRAAPVDGAANAALMKLLSEALGVPKTSVSIRGGGTSRIKVVEIEGLDQSALASRWPELQTTRG
jgi:uncharacterized protein YggU (UPF0235/DUF167 family)